MSNVIGYGYNHQTGELYVPWWDERALSKIRHVRNQDNIFSMLYVAVDKDGLYRVVGFDSKETVGAIANYGDEYYAIECYVKYSYFWNVAHKRASKEIVENAIGYITSLSV